MSVRGWRVPVGSPVSAELEESFAGDVAAGWPDGCAAVALLGFLDAAAAVVRVVGYSPDGSCMVQSDGWVSPQTRGALLALADAVLGGVPGTACVLATFRLDTRGWDIRVEASPGSGRWDIGMAQAVMIAQELNPIVEGL